MRPLIFAQDRRARAGKIKETVLKKVFKFGCLGILGIIGLLVVLVAIAPDSDQTAEPLASRKDDQVLVRNHLIGKVQMFRDLTSSSPDVIIVPNDTYCSVLQSVHGYKVDDGPPMLFWKLNCDGSDGYVNDMWVQNEGTSSIEAVADATVNVATTATAAPIEPTVEADRGEVAAVDTNAVDDAVPTESVSEPETSTRTEQVQLPQIVTNENANLRSGPGTEYTVAGSSPAGQPLTIVAQNAAGNWLKLDNGLWIARFLVDGTDGKTWPVDIAQPIIEVPAPVVEATATQIEAPTPVVATPTAMAVVQPPANSQCDPSYPDVCISPKSVVGDLDCGDIPQFARFRVLQPDPHGFDGNDNDGLGCESN